MEPQKLDLTQCLDSNEFIWPLRGIAQHYAWGRVGSSSAVAKLLAAGGWETIDETKPYAELWWAAHPSGCGSVVTKSQPTAPIKLRDFIALDPARFLGKETATQFDDQLPFLLKVLSIRQALSIQAHPDKTRAAKLHKDFPGLYADPNHKPEVAIAISKFKAMCGFRKFADIVQNIKEFPELKAVLRTTSDKLLAASGPDKKLLQETFAELMTADATMIQTQLQKLVARIQSNTDFLSKCILQVHKDFPGDSGVFCLLLLNVVELAPGEALYLAPNEPHAYFEGDCVECMANSDNVVRAGLTPKFKHVDTLIEMLTYRSEEPIDILHGENRDCELVYAPPIPEFQIGRIDVVPGETKEPRSSKAVSILIAIAGQGSLTDNASGDTFDLLPGASFFLAANASFKVTCHTDRLILYRATVSGGL